MSVQTLAPPRRPRWRLSPSARRAVLTAHIVTSVGLLGDCAVLLATAIRAATTSDPQLATFAYELMGMFGLVFGIPLSFASLATGLLLGLGGKWGVLRHRWVAAKLLLIVSVILVGALVIGPSEAAMTDGEGGRETVLIVAPAYQLLALGLATGLSVYKPRLRTSR
jgi:Sec-independent protein secretion pathway component TatC